jgi:hypothetical protein
MEEGRTEACRSHDGVFRQYKRGEEDGGKEERNEERGMKSK